MEKRRLLISNGTSKNSLMPGLMTNLNPEREKQIPLKMSDNVLMLDYGRLILPAGVHFSFLCSTTIEVNIPPLTLNFDVSRINLGLLAEVRSFRI